MYSVGDIVVAVDEHEHSAYPEWFPAVGTRGKIVNVGSIGSTDVCVKWQHGTVSDLRDEWFAHKDWIMPLTEYLRRIDEDNDKDIECDFDIMELLTK